MVVGYAIIGRMNTILNFIVLVVPHPQEQFQQIGDTLHIWANDVTTDYYKEKCCRQLVWKAPKYKDSPW